VAVLTVVIWWFFAAVTLVQLAFAKCPRCRRRFSCTWWCNWPFAKRCLHCDLSINARFDPSHDNLLTLRRWLACDEPRGPTPNVGLHCAECGYSLAELPEQRCPECGAVFNIESILAEAVSQLRK
jgi:phage FluMu protein Com